MGVLAERNKRGDIRKRGQYPLPICGYWEGGYGHPHILTISGVFIIINVHQHWVLLKLGVFIMFVGTFSRIGYCQMCTVVSELIIIRMGIRRRIEYRGSGGWRENIYFRRILYLLW